MAFKIPTLPAEAERLRNDLLDRAGAELSRSDDAVLAQAVAAVSYGLYGYIGHVSQQITPLTCDEEMLALFANLKKTYRTPETRAQGDIEVTGAQGVIVKQGHIWQTRGGIKLVCRIDTVLGSGVTLVPVAAQDAGRQGNLPAGTELLSVSPALGVSDKAIVSGGGVGGGAEIEPVDLWRARVCRSYEVIPHGGNKDDYEIWALQVPGVTRSWCVRNWMGPGTVGVFFVRDNDEDIVPNESAIKAVKDHIESVRPVTAELHVGAPSVRRIPYSLKIDPDTEALRELVTQSLVDLHNREADLGSSLLRSHIRRAISTTPGIHDHRVLLPAEDTVVAESNEILTVGAIQWS